MIFTMSKENRNHKIAFINQMAPIYRAPIYQLMDKEFDIDWFFGDSVDGIKEMDLSSLSSVKRFKTLNLIGNFYWQRGVIKLLFNSTYDSYIVHSQCYNLSLLVFMILNRILNINKKVFLWSHGWYGRETFLKKYYKKFFYGLSDKIFLYGNFARKKAIEQGNNGNKCIVIHNSLDYNGQLKIRNNIFHTDVYLRHFNNNNPVIIFVGRLTPIKKLDYLLKVVSILKEKNECFNVVLVGIGPEQDRLRSIANKLNLKVWFYGESYKEEELSNLIFNAELCVSPGNVGLTAMHSMAYGTPVITHDNFPNQMPEFEAIIPDKTGKFYKDGSIDSLAHTISEWHKAHRMERDKVRRYCQEEIDRNWTPQYQIRILKENIIID